MPALFLASSSRHHQEVHLLAHLDLRLHTKLTFIPREKKIEFSSPKVLIYPERCFGSQSPKSPHLRARL